MKLTIAEEKDQQQWDETVQESPNGSLLHTWQYIHLMEKYSEHKIFGINTKSKLYPLFITEKERNVGIYPLFLFKCLSGIHCHSPPNNVDVLFLGPLIPRLDEMKQEKKQIFLQDLQIQLDKFVQKDLRSNYIQINASPGFDDCRAFRWGGYTVSPRFTYYIDLTPGTDVIWRGFNRSLRYYIEKAKKEGITVSRGTVDDALFIHEQLRQRNRTKSPKAYIREVFDIFSPEHVDVYVARAGSERLSGIITQKYKDMVSFWVGAPKCSYKGLSPNELALWESIKDAGENGYKVFQIMGADDYSLFPFKRKFNGKIIPYYQMKWLSPSYHFGQSLYRSVKKERNYLESYR